QGWKPNSADHQFSPSFIYNQINRGQNFGSQIKDALELLKTRGCATMARVPYNEGDYRSQPNADAFREAQYFRCGEYYFLDTADQIRKALQQGNPVILNITTTPRFMNGGFEIFTSDMYDKPLGQHCVAAVGYDDQRSAFLIMNSWGTNWSKQG